MSGGYIVDQVSGEMPALDYFVELKDILSSFGVAPETFDGLTETAQVFLVGQYMQLRKAEDLLRGMQKRLERAERDIKRLRLQRDHLRNFLQESGVPESQLSVFNSQPMLPALREGLKKSLKDERSGDDETTKNKALA